MAAFCNPESINRSD